VLEVRRWWRYGPSKNMRSRFPINKNAPSYEPPPETAETAGPPPGPTRDEEPEMTDAKTRIDETVKSNDVVLYMKGTKSMPQCGFSSRVAGVLNYMGVEFQDINVLDDDGIRQGIKDYADWPTIPQLYVKGEFVGGCDIITEMTLSGELDQVFDKSGVSYDKDAADKIREANG
jgi:monothiol glutaredoxin